MKKIKNLIIGSGFSSFIYSNSSTKRHTVFSEKSNHVRKSGNFYEYNTIGGNSNIWGGYINIKRHNKFLKNRKYKKFIKKKIFHIKEIFEKDSIFSNTRCIVDKNDQVLRVQQKYFKSDLKVKKIEKIIINKKELKISADNEIYKIEKLVLCIGNLNLIDLLYKSELIFPNAIISYDDGNCSYVVNFLIDPKKNYYIPMPILNILEKLIFKKSNFYNITNSSFFLQKFNSITKKYKIKCKDLIENTNMNLRFFYLIMLVT